MLSLCVFSFLHTRLGPTCKFGDISTGSPNPDLELRGQIQGCLYNMASELVKVEHLAPGLLRSILVFHLLDVLQLLQLLPHKLLRYFCCCCSI